MQDSSKKKYKCGLYIGRFQPIHIGHEAIIRQMLDECEQVIIAVGSAQESGTMKNPFSFEQRADLILNIFYQYALSGRMSVIPIRDRYQPANDASWGDYLFQNVWDITHTVPDVVYEGEENERSTWYDNLDVEIVKVPRNKIRVSATELREALADDSDQLSFRAYAMLPAAITYRITDMRKVIKDAGKN